MVRYGLLGTVGVWSGGRPIDAGQPQQRAVLAALLVDAGQVLTWETLVDRAWGEAAPPNARGALRSHVSRVRRVLQEAHDGERPPRLAHEHGGYLLEVDSDLVDLHRFRRLTSDAREQTGTAERRVELLREAVSLWRGTPLAGIPGEWAARMRESWQSERLDVMAAWADAEVRVDNPEAVLGQLAALAADHPLVEPLAAALMRALHAAGRSADALEHYARVRGCLADELGADPGPELQAVHRAILRGDLDPPDPPDPAPAETRVVTVVPRQLPADVRGFAGRADELAHLDKLVERPAATLVTYVVSGPAGVGKTALAVHWAHGVTALFPDGQLYVNLRGFDPSGTVTSTAEAVRGFLDAFGVPAERIPTAVDSQVGLYRSLAAGRQLLILLDDARDADQVRRLLPGTSTALVVVTSRGRLTGLVAAGAYPLPLNVMSAAEGREVLAGRVGRDRVAAERDAAAAIIEACAGLPLALGIAGARAQSGFPLAAIADELAEAYDRLDALDADDASTGVRAVFSWSYATLTPSAARLFRLLGLHPGPDVSVPAAASLAGCSRAAARRLLAELAGAGIVTEHLPGRYTFHDLLRDYATELVHAGESVDERRRATARVWDHYLVTASVADRLLHPARDPMPVRMAEAEPGTYPEDVSDHVQAMAWLVAEHAVLLGILRSAAHASADTRTWQLAWAMDTFLYRRGHLDDRLSAWRAGLAAARRFGDRAAEAYAHRSLAATNSLLGRYDEATVGYERALHLYALEGDQTGQGHTHHNLGFMWQSQGQPQRALDHVLRAYALFQAAGHHWGEAEALNAAGWCHVLLGHHDEAITYCRQARALNRLTGNRAGEAHALDSLGYAYYHLDLQEQAADCYNQALDLFREVGDRYHESETLVRLGKAQEAAGDRTAARIAWQSALAVLDDADADAVRGALRSLGG